MHPSVTATRQIEILKLEDLEREYVLSRTRLTLVQHNLSTAALAGERGAEEPPCVTHMVLLELCPWNCVGLSPVAVAVEVLTWFCVPQAIPRLRRHLPSSSRLASLTPPSPCAKRSSCH